MSRSKLVSTAPAAIFAASFPIPAPIADPIVAYVYHGGLRDEERAYPTCSDANGASLDESYRAITASQFVADTADHDPYRSGR